MQRSTNRRYDALWANEEQDTRRRDLFDSNDESMQQMVHRRRPENCSTEQPSRSLRRNEDSNLGMQMSRSTNTPRRRSPDELTRPSAQPARPSPQQAQPERHTLWNDSDTEVEDSCPPRSARSITPPRRVSPSPAPVYTRRARSRGPLDDEPEFFPEGFNCNRGALVRGRTTRHQTAVQHQFGCEFCFESRGEAEMVARECARGGEVTGVVFGEHVAGLFAVMFYDMC